MKTRREHTGRGRGIQAGGGAWIHSGPHNIVNIRVFKLKPLTLGINATGGMSHIRGRSSAARTRTEELISSVFIT